MKFKTGDWVTSNSFGIGKIESLREGCVTTVRVKGWYTKDTRDNTINYDINIQHLQLWQPKEGEWCWFSYNSECNACFGRFIGMDGSKFIAGETCSHTYSYPYCEPFIGELPSFIKDKQ